MYHGRLNYKYDRFKQFFYLEFTPCNAEQLLRGMELEKKKYKMIKAYRKSV